MTLTRFFICCCLAIELSAFAQDKQSVLVKTFDQQLKPLANLVLAVNGGEFFQTGGKGTVIREFHSTALPPRSVVLQNEELEAESWNYSKGVLEIIVRRKSYRMVELLLRAADGRPVAGKRVTFEGRSEASKISGPKGEVVVPLGLTEQLSSVSQLSIEGHAVQRIQRVNDREYIIHLELPVAKAPIQKTEKSELAGRLNLNELDSIRSLTVFYSVFKNQRMATLTEEQKDRVDRKFRQLISQLEDSLRNPGKSFLGKISDSSFVGDDVRNLLAQAEAEERTLDQLRGNFDEKIRVLTEKLDQGAESMDADTRDQVYHDIKRLESILKLNEEKFNRNKGDYQSVLNSLKEKFFETKDLEEKLSLSEAQREEDRAEYQKKFFTIFLVTLCFAVLTIALVYFSNRLKRQKQELEVANGEVRRINENLEQLVSDRTALLESAHREMDIFLYKASHDLRGPICSIIGLCNIASRTMDGDSLEIVNKTYDTAFAMDRMLKKLKFISEINHPTNYSLVMLDEHIRAVQQEFRKFVRDNNVHLRIDCPAAISFHSYPNLIEVILRSLVENALYFSTIATDRRPVVEIKAAHRKKHVEIVVRDNGIGIDDEIRDRIWDMFFIGSEHSHGNGLGLYIVKKSVHVLQGSIDVVSEKGQFTEVTVHVPVRESLVVGPRAEQPLLLSADKKD